MPVDGMISIVMQALQTKSKRGKLKIILLGVAVLIAVSIGGYIMWRMNHKPTPPTEPYVATSEGAEFTVPAGVAEESIKNYTLVSETEQFKIRQDGKKPEYVITLYAIINRPEQYNEYEAQLREFKHNALEELKNKGVDPNKVKIIYEPAQATDL